MPLLLLHLGNVRVVLQRTGGGCISQGMWHRTMFNLSDRHRGMANPALQPTRNVGPQERTVEGSRFIDMIDQQSAHLATSFIANDDETFFWWK